jgi:phage regulator Rha-like protein
MTGVIVNNNSNIIEFIKNEPRVSHRVIAEHTQNKQKSILDLITRYLKDFQEFGEVEFNDLKSLNGGRPQRVYFLNEQQATLLLTYLKNSEVVRNFKKQLVKAFYKMRMQLQKVESPKPEISISETLSKSVEILHLIQLLKEQKTFDLFLLDGILENESPTKLLKIDFSQKYFLPTELGFLKGMSGAEMNLELQKKVFKFVKMKSGF